MNENFKNQIINLLMAEMKSLIKEDFGTMKEDYNNEFSEFIKDSEYDEIGTDSWEYIYNNIDIEWLFNNALANAIAELKECNE